MLKTLVRAATSRWSVAVLAALWVVSLLWTVHTGWVWVEPADPSDGHDPWVELRATPLFIWLGLILAGYAATWFKRRSLGHYGLIEVTCGLVGGYFALAELPLTQASAWLATAASAFVVVRGVENVQRSLA